jgi:prepilin-type N-terminal cleavage/methylation domain-containing protein
MFVLIARQRGFTILEILVALTLLAVVFGIIGQVFYTALDSVSEVRTRAQLQEDTTLAMNRIIWDLRDARTLEINDHETDAEILTTSGSVVRYRFDVAESVAYRMKDQSSEQRLLGNSIVLAGLKFDRNSHMVCVRMMTRAEIPGSKRYVRMTLLTCTRVGD